MKNSYQIKTTSNECHINNINLMLYRFSSYGFQVLEAEAIRHENKLWEDVIFTYTIVAKYIPIYTVSSLKCDK